MPITRPITRSILSPLTRAVTAGGGGSLPVATHYVSSTATNGYAVGVNAGGGTTKAAPWLTVDYAIANAPTGSVIEVNSGTYQSATFYNVNDKSLTIQASTPGAVTLTAANTQTRVINLGLVATTRTLRLQNLIIDGRNDTTRGLSLGSSSLALGIGAGLIMRNCTIKDCTTSYIQSVSHKTVNYDIAGLTCSGTALDTGIFIGSAQEGSVVFNGVTFSAVNTGSGKQGIWVTEAAGSTGITCRVYGVGGTIDTTNAASSWTAIRLENMDGAEIRGCSLTVTGGASTGMYVVQSSTAGLTAHNAVIAGNGGHNGGATHGYCIRVGTDGTSAGNNQHNDALIENNSITANPTSTDYIHGIMLGWGSGGTVRNNTMNGAAYGLLAKDWTGGVFEDNVTSNFAQSGIYAKAANGTTFRRNTLHTGIANLGGSIRVGPDTVPGVNSTGVVIQSNTVNVTVNPPRVVYVEAGSDATFSTDTYNISATLGTSPHPWEYQGTGYDTLTAWKAVEPTALP